MIDWLALLDRFAQRCRRGVCRYCGHVWHTLPNAPPEGNETFWCLRCDEIRHERRLAGERPIAWTDQQAAKRRAERDSE